MAAEIKDVFPGAKVSLIEGSGGVFDVTVDDKLLFSKFEVGRHAQPDEVVDLIRQSVG